MRSIYKYPIDGEIIIAPVEKVLDVQFQENNVPVVWILINDELPQRKVQLSYVGTGWPVSYGPEWNYVNTTQDNMGYVWHWFECSDSGI